MQNFLVILKDTLIKKKMELEEAVEKVNTKIDATDELLEVFKTQPLISHDIASLDKAFKKNQRRKVKSKTNKKRKRKRPTLPFNVLQLCREWFLANKVKKLFTYTDVTEGLQQMGYPVEKQSIGKSLNYLFCANEIRKTNRNGSNKYYIQSSAGLKDIRVAHNSKRWLCSACEEKFVVQDDLCIDCNHPEPL